MLTDVTVIAVTLILIILISYPLAIPLRYSSPSKPAIKYLYIIWYESRLMYICNILISFYSVSACYLFAVFGDFKAHFTLLISSCFTYTVAKYVKGPSMPWIGASLLMVHLSYLQIPRQLSGRASSSGSWIIDISTPQSLLVVKLTSFCWNVHDGRQPEERLSKFQKERAVRLLPSLLDFVGYVFFFPSLLTGPGFEFAEYRRWVDSPDFCSSPELAKEGQYRSSKISSTFSASTSKLIQAFAWLLISIKFSTLFPATTLLSPAFSDGPIHSRVLYLHLFGLATRARCYAIWTLTEGALITSGFAFPTNINPIAVELAQNPHKYVSNWNINTGRC
jgi:lysophospholipid acyltransferase